MAFATARLPLPLPPQALTLPRRHRSSTSARLPKAPSLPRLRLLPPPSSLDVSKEDKDPASVEGEDPQLLDSEARFDRRRLEERFVVLNTGIHECLSCGHLYDQAVGDPSYPIAPGIEFSMLPEDWRCPTCGAAKSFFVSKSVEVAGFAQNQQFGLGGNSLTGSQKAIVIYGSLFLFFALFLSGYFLQ